MNKETVIIGAGNMGRSIAEGMVQNGLAKRDEIILTNSKTNNNKEAASHADVVIFAVKPQVMKQVLQEVGDIQKDSLGISVAAGIAIDTIDNSLNAGDHKIVRVMPNLGASVGESMSVWVANQHVSELDKQVVGQILGSIGKKLEVHDEDMIDKATAISGSGPAYFFYIVELLTEMGKKFGFSDEDARLLAEQTFIGSAKVLEKSHQDAGSLRRAVTSKGGTTEAAFKRFGRERLGARFMRGVEMAYARAKQLRKIS